MLRLIDEAHLAARDRVPEIVLDHPALVYLSAHPGLEEPVCAAALALGLVERRVGMAEEDVALGRVIRVERDADAGRDLGAALVEPSDLRLR